MHKRNQNDLLPIHTVKNLEKTEKMKNDSKNAFVNLKYMHLKKEKSKIMNT